MQSYPQDRTRLVPYPVDFCVFSYNGKGKKV